MFEPGFRAVFIKELRNEMIWVLYKFNVLNYNVIDAIVNLNKNILRAVGNAVNTRHRVYLYTARTLLKTC